MNINVGDIYSLHVYLFVVVDVTNKEVCVKYVYSNYMYIVSMNVFKRDYSFYSQKIDSLPVPWYKRILPRRFR